MTPVERLRAYIAEMLGWETTFHIQRRSRNYKQDAALRAQVDQEAKRKLAKIFNEHLSAKAVETKTQSRLVLLNTGNPPTFAQQVIDDSESHVGTSIYIETFNEKALTQRQRYAIVIEHGEPKIDSVYDWRRSTGKWDKQDSI